MKRWQLPGGILLVVAGLGWLAVLGIRVQMLPNWMFVGSFQADLLALVFLASLGVTILAVFYGAAVLALFRSLKLVRVRQQQADQTAHRRFISRLDHEMKNPLAIMRIGLLNLREGETQSITRVEQQFQRLQKLLEDLRYLTDLEQYPIDKTAVSMQEVLEEAVALTCPDDRHIEMKIQEVPWPLSPVLGDADLLLVVFRNVLDNALKYTSPDDQIEVRASEDGQSAVIEIADTGVGIAPEELGSVFEELYRGKNVGTVTGSGLGLPMVQKIIALHEGRFDLHSRLGQGTLLRIRLPLVRDV